MDFSYLTNTATDVRVIAGRIPPTAFTRGSLIVRLHNAVIDQRPSCYVRAYVTLPGAVSRHGVALNAGAGRNPHGCSCSR